MSAHRYDDAIFHDPREDSLFSGFELVNWKIGCDNCSEWFPIRIFSLESFIEPVKSLLDVGFVAVDRSYIVVDDGWIFGDGFEWEKIQSARVFFRRSESSISSDDMLLKMRLVYEVSLEYFSCEISFPDSYTTSYQYRLISAISKLSKDIDCSFVLIVYDHTSSLNRLGDE